MTLFTASSGCFLPLLPHPYAVFRLLLVVSSPNLPIRFDLLEDCHPVTVLGNDP